MKGLGFGDLGLGSRFGAFGLGFGDLSLAKTLRP